MSRFIRALIVVAGLGGIGFPAAAHAQYMIFVQRSEEPRDPADSGLVRAVQHDIQHVRLAEDAHYAMMGRYTAQLSDLSDLHLDSGATFELSNATATTWNLVVTHPRLTGEYRLQIKRDPVKPSTIPPAPSR